MRRKPLLSWLYVLAAFAPLSAFAAQGFHTLSLKRCVPLEKSAFSAFAKEWAPYERYTRVCPLTVSTKDEAKVSIISVFTESYYEDHKDETRWLDFPRPKFVDKNGTCLAVLPYVFPDNHGEPLVVRFLSNADAWPSIIRVHSPSQAVMGAFDLPDLTWNPSQRQYVIIKDISEKQKGKYQCKI